ncbi:MAG: hypothetical protein KJ574_03555, partial [Nanoarchaeota archaeon]|nr:hypothetical protein [Nanoarchaeota archaeon]
ISKKNNALQAGNITIFFLGKEEADAFKAAHPGVEIPAPFDEVNSTRYPKVKELFFAIQKVDDKTNQRLFKYLPIQLRAGKNPSDQQLEAMFQKLFFNKNDYSIIYQDHDGKFYPVMNAKDFNLKVMQFLIFHHFKEENFDKMLNAVVEPFFLTPVDMMAFLNYKSGREASWKLIKRFLKKQYEQGDITAEDMRQIWRFMSVGFEELSKSQDAIAKEVSQGKKPKYITFIKRPYLVHQLMIDVFRIAVFAEARAKSNKEHEMIYTGRESGYEGGNTVAVHGYNNYTKYKRMLSVVMPVLQKEKEELFDHLEGFKAWLVMGLHDAATYDRQNSIAYGAMDKYENSNKKAHNMIGAYILREHQVIKKLFDSETGEIESESEERKDLNMLANIIHNHDYTKIHLDIYNVGTEDFNVIKQLVCFTLSGIADNSAGVGFLDEHDKVCVDPWEEKGSSVFLVTDRPKDLLGRPLTPKSNGEIMFEILENEFNQKDYYKTEKGKAEWATILEIVRANINSMPEGIVKQKLLRGIEDKEFSATSAIWTAGVLNSGFMRFLSYDGVTMRMNIIMDSDINRKLEKNVGENFVFARVTRFLEEYKKYFKGSSSELASRGKLKIHNSDMNGDKLDSIGLDVHIIEMSGIIDMTLIEKASQQLLGILKARYEEPVYNIKAA